MDFQELLSESREWTNKTKKFDICNVNENEKRLDFKTVVNDQNFTFFLSCAENLEVWSEDEKVICHLQDIYDFCDRGKTVTQILDRVLVLLKPILKDDEDDDEEFEDCEEDVDDVGDDDYYNDDEDALRDETVVKENNKEDSPDEDDNFFGATGNPAAVSRLYKDLKNMQKAKQFGIEGIPRGDNLFIWDVKLKDIPDDTQLGKDLRKYASAHKREPVVQLEMQFPGEYPMAPPFVRVIRPRFKFLTGHVTIGGSICMELLTKSGWVPSNDIESILVQIRCEIMSDPNARLDGNPDRAYGEQEARDAFNRMVQRYGWNK